MKLTRHIMKTVEMKSLELMLSFKCFSVQHEYAALKSQGLVNKFQIRNFQFPT